jgi:hypothetical protein
VKAEERLTKQEVLNHQFFSDCAQIMDEVVAVSPETDFVLGM